MADSSDTNSIAGKLAAARGYKEQGNALFRKGEYKKSIKQYRSVFLYTKGLVKASDESMRQYAKQEDVLDKSASDGVDELNRSVYSNLAAVYLKLNRFDEAVDAASHALQLNSKDSKSLLRKGQAYMGLKDWKRAKDTLVEADKLEPKNAAIQSALKEWKTLYAAWSDEMKAKELTTFGGKLL